MRRGLLLLVPFALAEAQSLQEAVLAQGEKIFNQTCAVGYCHGAKGVAGGAPRLAARGFDQAFINATVSRGVPGTAMAAFANTLSRPELAAVVTYVATLNGIANPVLNAVNYSGPGGAASSGPTLSEGAARGRDLFSDSVRSFARCSTCHEVNGLGIPVVEPLDRVPSDVAALRALATSHVRTATVDGESMPALVVSQGKLRTIFYDLTSAPPVLRTLDPAAVKIAEGSGWRHSSAIGAYDDGELKSILTFLREVIKP
jgi:mono/diheme cytochrome c family protein